MAIANLSKIEQIERKTVYLYTPHFKIKLFEIATLQSICLFNHYTLYIYFDSVVLFFLLSHSVSQSTTNCLRYTRPRAKLHSDIVPI